MSEFFAVRDWPKTSQFKKNDVFVIFGEVFERGYVNGIIDEAKAVQAKIIYSTVGRRDENQNLRKLTPDELTQKGQYPLINIPLEAGFDLEPASNGMRPVDQLKEYGLNDWQDAKLDWKAIEESYQNGTERFRKTLEEYFSEVEKHLEPNSNLILVHTMAGGFPRAKVVMPIANRVFKGIGPRYLSSELFWQSEIGRLCEKSFNAVTAETFKHMIEMSAPVRNKVNKNGGMVRFAAFGYHGNEVLIGDNYEWYSYSPYLQGFAKVALENYATTASANSIPGAVFNVPEILTNSSSIFLGVEVVLYPLMRALKKEGKNSIKAKEIIESCLAKIRPEFTFDDIDKITQDYLTHPQVRAWPKFVGWPQHNGPEQMEHMRNASQKLIEMHKDQKDLMTQNLSEVVFRACGKIMFHELASPRKPVMWIGHDAVAKATCMS